MVSKLIRLNLRKLREEISEANIYDWPEVTCILSPWKIAATTIQMQLQVKKLGRTLSHESTAVSAAANLNKLTSMLFHHTQRLRKLTMLEKWREVQIALWLLGYVLFKPVIFSGLYGI